MNTLQNLINLLKKIGLTNKVVGEQFLSGPGIFKLKNPAIATSISVYYAGLRLSAESWILTPEGIKLAAPFPINPDDIILVDYEWQ